jgi:hypothetical protein
VVLLVVTKDLWSLRLNSEFSVVGTLLQYLRLRPSEQNFLGRNKQLSLDFTLRLDTVSLGQAYVDPRVLGSRFALSQSAAIVLSRANGQPEGSRGSLSFGLPLYSLASKHAFSVSGAFDVRTARIFRGASVWRLPYPDEFLPVATVPYVYRAREVVAGAVYTRSFGTAYKTNLSGGVGVYQRRYTPPGNLGLTEPQKAWLVDTRLPYSEEASYLSGHVRAFEARYAVLRDAATFALPEDYQLGHNLSFGVRAAEPTPLASARFVELGATARYRLLQGEDLFTVKAAGRLRRMLGHSTPWVNRRAAFELSNLSPPLGPGRVVARALLDVRGYDLGNPVVLLGGGNGLRGLAPDALNGQNQVLFNLEYRTKPLELYTLHLGGVLFWDAGAAYVGRPKLVHAVGIGLRALFPQFDVETLRIDFGYVIDGPRPGWPDRFSASFGQVTDFRPAFIDEPL